MTTLAQPVTGQDINVTARATRKALEVLLAEQGTSFAPVATLNTIVAIGRSLDSNALVRYLSDAFAVDEQTVRTTLHGLETRGFVKETPLGSDPTPHFQLTADGQAEQRRLGAVTAELTAELYRGLDAEELATTRRVLVTLQERAAEHVASRLG